MNQKETSAPANNPNAWKNTSLKDKILLIAAGLSVVLALGGMGYFVKQKMDRDKKTHAKKTQQELKVQGDQEHSPVKEENDSIPMGENDK